MSDTHARNRRCPSCKKLRRFYPHRLSMGWKKIDNVWTCPWCIQHAADAAGLTSPASAG